MAIPTRLWQRRWIISGALGALAFVLGYWGFSRTPGSDEAPTLAYQAIQLFFLESGDIEGTVPWQLHAARFLAPATAAGLSVIVLLAIINERLEQARVRMMANHVVVCGLGEMGSLLVRSVRERGIPVAVIERDATNELIEEARGTGAIVIIGDAHSEATLRRAGVLRASHLVSVCGRDNSNAEVAIQAQTHSLGRKRGTLTCLAHIVEPRVCLLMRAEELSSRGTPAFRLDFFNIFESGVRALFKKHAPFDSRSQQATPSVIVIGLGRLGESLAVQAAREWRTLEDVAGRQLRVVIIDIEATSKAETLRSRHPDLDSSWELVTHDAVAPALESRAVEVTASEATRTGTATVFVCADRDEDTLSLGLALHKRTDNHRVPIVMTVSHSDGLARLLSAPEGLTDYRSLYAFSLLDETLSADVLLGGSYELLARAMHAEYVRDRAEGGETIESNPSMAPWEDLPDHLKESNRANAGHIGVKLSAAGCTLVPIIDSEAESFSFSGEEIELLAEMEHERWVEERKREGWRFADGEKDIDAKTTPYLVPWCDLTDEVKEWDRVFVRGLPKFVARAGFQIVRMDSIDATSRQP